MATVRRGTSQYVSTSVSMSHNVPLPVGSQVGDWVIIGASNQAFAATFTLPGTTVLEAGNNTLRYGLCTKQLTSGDVTDGYLTIGISSSQQMTAVCVGYSEAYGFAAPGAVWDKGAVSLAYTNAPATVSDGTQDILVFSLIKHSGASQSYVSASPATTSLTTALKTGTGMPSAHVGVYTGSAADRTDNWSVASSNGVGFQIAVNGNVPPVNYTIAEYNSGTLELAGANVTNATDIEIIPETGYDRVLLKESGTGKYFQWNLSIQAIYGVRFYIHLPASWAETGIDLFRGLNGSGSEIYSRANLSGTGSPARMRWAKPDGTHFASTGPILTPGAVYRVELQSDTDNDLMRGAIWSLGSDTPAYDSGWVAGNDGEGGAIFRFGVIGTPPVGLVDLSISRVLVSTDISSWIGRHSTDELIVSTGTELLGVWNGTALEPATLLGVWNGASVDEVHMFGDVAPVEVLDTFTAVDGTFIAGRTTETGGKTWTHIANGVWAITGNEAYKVSGSGDAIVGFDMGSADHAVEWVLNSVDDWPQLCGRMNATGTDYVGWGPNEFVYRAGGSWPYQSNYPYGVTATVRMEFRGTELTLFLNDVLQATLESTQTGTYVGMRADGPAARVAHIRAWLL